MTVLQVVPAVPTAPLRLATVAIDPATSNPVAVLPTASSIGAGICIELQAPNNGAAVFTVPAGKAFRGVAYCTAAGTAGGVVSLSAATGGVFYSTTSPAIFAPVAVSIAYNASTNAVTVVTSGGGTAPSIVIVGHFTAN